MSKKKVIEGTPERAERAERAERVALFLPLQDMVRDREELTDLYGLFGAIWGVALRVARERPRYLMG